MNLAVLKTHISEIIRWLEDHPFAIMILGGLFLFFALMTMRNRQSSSGMFFYVIIGCALFMWGLGCFTGLGFFSMSF